MARIPDKKYAAKKKAVSYTTVAPTGGLNTRDPYALMDPIYAINLTNFIASPQGVEVRKGNRAWATGLPGDVDSLMAYAGQSATDKLFAASSNAIYDVTAGGAVGAAVISGLSSTQFSRTNFAAAAGTYLVVANGIDPVMHYNGINWTTWTTAAVPSSPGQISGVAPNVIHQVITHQRRLWFVQTTSTKAWYTPVNAVGGALASFDFGPLFSRGGSLVALGSWTVNNSTGPSNRLVAISSEGDVAIYDGTDPSSATAWSLAGTWKLGRPVGNNCLLNYGGDLLYMSSDGLVPLSQYLQTTSTTPAISDTIRSVLSSLTMSQASLPGWVLQDYLSNNLLIVNVPQASSANNIQFVYNTITRGWSVFTGWPALCWETLNSEIYFGTDGEVRLAFTGYKDNAEVDGTGGDIYTASAQTAFNYFEDRARTKRFQMARINILTRAGDPSISIGVNTDFNITPPSDIGSAITSTGSLWNTAIWGVGIWNGGIANLNDWQSVTGVGYCGSISIALSVTSETVWVSTDWILEQGGMIG